MFEGAENGMPSVIDAIVLAAGCTRDRAWTILTRILANQSIPKEGTFKQHKFKGQGQRKTPTTDWITLMEIMSLIPGEFGDFVRQQNAKVALRAKVGDAYFRDAIEHRIQQPPVSSQESIIAGEASSAEARAESEEKREDEERAS